MPINAAIKNEVLRKIIHISTAIIPMLYFYYLNREQISILMIFLLLLILTGDILRIYVTKLGQIYENLFGKLLRPSESDKQLNGATMLLFGFTLAVLLFKKDIAIISMLILALSDSFAAIAGKSFGRIKLQGKTLEGSVTFFLITWVVAGLFNENTGINVLGAALITVFELYSDKLNDNISIPLFSGLFFTLAKNF